jgi:hypothetical protein
MIFLDVMLCRYINICTDLPDYMGSPQKNVILMFADMRASKTHASFTTALGTRKYKFY